MSTPPVNVASPIKSRASRAQMIRRHEALRAIVRKIEPCTVRQVFYQATVLGQVPKTEAGYAQVQRALADMRRAGTLPYHWIVDNTRWQRKPASYRSPAEAVEEVATFYRKNLWAQAEAYVEIWLEKDALSGVVYQVTSEYDVPLMVARGYSSLSFLHSSAQYIAQLDRPTSIYHLGDFDPSGVNAAEKIQETLLTLAPRAQIHFERIAVLPWQIESLNLPSRPTKTTDSRAKKFGYAESVELDAIPPDMLRMIVESAIVEHLPDRELEVLRVAEESEREFLRVWAQTISGEGNHAPH